MWRTTGGTILAFMKTDDPLKLLVALKLSAGNTVLFSLTLEKFGNTVPRGTVVVAGNGRSGFEGAADWS
jgi:hypothetical protein